MVASLYSEDRSLSIVTKWVIILYKEAPDSWLKVALKKNIQYPSNELFRKMDVLDLRQLFVKNLLVFMFNSKRSLFNPVTHADNTRFSTAVGIITP